MAYLVKHSRLIAFLLLGGVGLFSSFHLHRRWYPLVLHLVSAAGIYVFTIHVYAPVVLWASVVGLIAASVWNVFLKRACRVAA